MCFEELEPTGCYVKPYGLLCPWFNVGGEEGEAGERGDEGVEDERQDRTAEDTGKEDERQDQPGQTSLLVMFLESHIRR